MRIFFYYSYKNWIVLSGIVFLKACGIQKKTVIIDFINNRTRNYPKIY